MKTKIKGRWYIATVVPNGEDDFDIIYEPCTTSTK